MIKRQLLAIGLLAAAGSIVHAQEAGKTDPESGKNCVAFFSSENTDTGLVRMHYRNICNSPFQIQITGKEKTRKGSIEAGTPKKPAKAYVTCKSSDVCETAEWKYE